MGMGVDIVGLSVRCPTGMADTQRTGQVSTAMNHVGKHLETALAFSHTQSVCIPNGNTGRVIATVFQSSQTVQ